MPIAAGATSDRSHTPLASRLTQWSDARVTAAARACACRGASSPASLSHVIVSAKSTKRVATAITMSGKAASRGWVSRSSAPARACRKGSGDAEGRCTAHLKSFWDEAILEEVAVSGLMLGETGDKGLPSLWNCLTDSCGSDDDWETLHGCSRPDGVLTPLARRVAHASLLGMNDYLRRNNVDSNASS